ncbi:MAG: RHS repeat protein [Bacteroidales bacterium]|nr:RHS repeat protein [Bacteroidales bacterium]
MKRHTTILGLCLILLWIHSTEVFSGWELISPDRDIRNVVQVEDTWFGVERIQNGTVLQMLLVSSTDNGFTWHTSDYFAEIFQITSNGSRILLRATKAPDGWGYFLSDVKGSSWKKLAWPFSFSGSDIFLTDSALYISIAKNPGVTSPVYRSLDDGDSFQPLNIDVGDRSFGFGRDFGNFAIHSNSIFVFVGRVGVFESNDDGVTWTLRNNGLPFTDVDYDYTIGVLSQGTSDLYMYFGSIGATYLESYKYQNGVWELYRPDTYYYEPYYDKYVKTTYISPSPSICRLPYMFTTPNAYTFYGNIHYSVDNGKTWFNFLDSNIGTVYWNSMLIHSGYIYAGTISGFARRRLSEAVNHNVEISRKSINEELPVSPEEFQNLLNMLGADALEELMKEYGLDTDEISNDELAGFLSDYIDDNGISDDLFSNSQPGVCNYMGMPLWSLNVANLKLFIRDVIFRKKGLGPELELACSYIHSADSTAGIFGKKWYFNYASQLVQKDSSVILTTGTGASFVFTEDLPVVTGASSFTLPCINKNNYQLHWDGNAWMLEKNRGAELNHFQRMDDSTFILSTVEDAYNKKINITHNAQKQPVLITDGSNRIYRLTYKNNKCDSIVLPDGRFALFSYSNDYLVSSTDFAGITTVYTYDSLNNISSVDVGSKLTCFEYAYDQDSEGMVSAVVDPENRKIEYHSSFRDSATVITSVTYPGSEFITYQLHSGRVTAITNSAGETKRVFYNPDGPVDSLVWYNGASMSFEYDANGNIISKKELRDRITNYVYDANNNLTNVLESDGDTIFSKTFNVKNQLESFILPGNRATVFEYDIFGALSKIISPAGHMNTFTRDEFGNINSYTNPAGNTLFIEYDGNGYFPVSRTDFMGNTYSLDYDANGRLASVTMPDGNKRIFHYDCCAQTGFTDENGNTCSVVRDNTNRILSRNYAEGWSLNLSYDDNGLLSGFNSKYGMVETYKYNDRGLVVSRIHEDGSVTCHYNDFGQIESIIDKKGNRTSYRYNDRGKLNEITDAVNHKTIFEFDGKDRITSVTNARGHKTEYLYHTHGQVSNKKSGSALYASYEYNDNGLMTAYTDSSGTTRYTRNNLGFVTKITYPGDIEVGFSHDANGNITGITYPGGIVVTNTMDNMNRITKISWSGESIDFNYNPSGHMLSETRNNNTKVEYNYNRDNNLIETNHYSNDNIFTSESVKYTNGIITGIDILYAAEITHAPKQIQAVSTNALNQLVSTYNGYTYLYDSDGNMTTASENEAHIMEASYNHENLMTSLKSGSEDLKVYYDAMRYPRRITSQNNVTNLFYDHKGRLLFETDAAGSLTIMYVYKGRRLVALQNADDEVFYYHTNRLGHVVALTDQNGNIVNKYAYTAGGEILGKSETVYNRFTFLGGFGAIRLTDDYILTGAKIYNPITGRFIQRDPLGLVTGTNQYLYTSNNPVAGIDPLGLDDQETTDNTLEFDMPSDNDYGTAGGTANPYAENLPYRSNNWDIYGSAAINTLEEFSNHPAFDLVPDFIALPVSGYKALNKLAEGDIGGALWQFMPFNNSIDAAGEYMDERLKYIDSSKSSGLGIFGEFYKNKTFTCDL